MPATRHPAATFDGHLLLCDLGGTNARFALARDGAILPGTGAVLANDSAGDFTELLRRYLAIQPAARPHTMVLALAALATGDRVRLTNRDWVIDRHDLAAVIGARVAPRHDGASAAIGDDRGNPGTRAGTAPRAGTRARAETASPEPTVHLLNDVAALAHALDDVSRLELRTLQAGRPDPGAPALVINAGTGFNSATHLADGLVIPAETGARDFTPLTALDLALRDRVAADEGRCRVERLVSGGGLARIHAHLAGLATPLRSPEVVARRRAGEGAADAACRAFARMLGQATGDLALGTLPAGGVFLAGGGIRALADLLAEPDGPFLTAFRDKAPQAAMLERLPIHVLTDDDAALPGCLAWHARRPS